MVWLRPLAGDALRPGCRGNRRQLGSYGGRLPRVIVCQACAVPQVPGWYSTAVAGFCYISQLVMLSFRPGSAKVIKKARIEV